MPNKETEEKVQHSSLLIPYSFYECRIPKSSMVTMHWHSELEINRILHGKGVFICGDDKFVANEGDLIVMPPNMLHAAYPCQCNLLYYHALVFNSSMLNAGSNDRCTLACIRPLINGSVKIVTPLHPGLQNYPELKHTIDHIFSYALKDLPQTDLLLKSELLRLFALLNNEETMTVYKKNGISYSEIIRPALEYMLKNYRENISIEQLAALTHLSKSHFMNCFKKAVGIGAIEHLNQLRISVACNALLATDKPVSEICFDCGFGNLSNFNRHFKKIMGCAPTEYRTNNQITSHPITLDSSEH